MPPDGLVRRIVLPASLTPPPLAWQRPLAQLGAVWCALIALLHADWADMFAQWWDISTYNHILLVPPIIAWLVQQRAGGLARLSPLPWWPGLVLFAAAAAVWLLGSFAGLAILRQIGAVSLLVAAVPALWGPRVSAGLIFPLGYMLFLVPFGEELVPPMQMVTAAMTVGLVHLSQISASIDGVFIDTPAGLFEVAEACSGVKFLIAMLAFAVLTAHVCFRDWRRRTAFLAFALTVPIVANGARAWATIFAAQYVGIERAAGIDHIVYGWVFFGVVIAATLVASWRFFDRPPGDPLIDPDALLASPLLGRLEKWRTDALRMAVGLAAIVALMLAWSGAAERLSAPLPRQIFLPQVKGWARADYAPRAWWEPRAGGADHRLLGSYADARGRRVDVFIALYGSQTKGKRATGFGEGALRADSGWAWLKPGPAMVQGKADWLLGPGRTERLALTAYRTGDLLTGSAPRLALANMADRAALRTRPTAMLILSAESSPGKPADEAIAAFRQSTGPLSSWVDRITQSR